ncbi:hypothetical protein A8924_1534 [Saccharopolyspora erythraea NRRL 2338]|uniref:Pycsar effector protein domain-containing protein n=1 Tax=Saccharopolyspora erythraea TaxID=1836 RepID=A0ABN1D3X0_SACER|nr:hypothetical protein N599_07940 [Saccharopolyspora erythraea D]PFG94263.1 hypothetical protein A8924_1534 [Saccharopolyspora erythraea NRRL 2338]
MSAETTESLNAAVSQVRDELRRADTKATTLLTLVGAAFAGVVSLTRTALPTASEVALWAAAVPIAASVLVLLAVVFPYLDAGEPGSFLHAARSKPAELVELHSNTESSPERVAVTMVVVSQIARRKYRRIAWAVRLLVTGLVVLLVALALAAVLGGA